MDRSQDSVRCAKEDNRCRNTWWYVYSDDLLDLAKTSSDENDLGYKLNDGKRLRFVNEDVDLWMQAISMSLFKDILPKDIKSKSHIAQRGLA